jgi:hypothetical protein
LIADRGREQHSELADRFGASVHAGSAAFSLELFDGFLTLRMKHLECYEVRADADA